MTAGLASTKIRPAADSVVNDYITAAKRFPILTPEEELNLARRWRENGDQEAANRLVQSHLRLVIKIAYSFRGYGSAVGDLIGEGNIGLMKSLKRYDPNRGFRFSTFALWWIRAEISEYVVRNASMVKLGTTADQKKLFFRLRQMKTKLGVYGDHIPPEIVRVIASNLHVSAAAVLQMNARFACGTETSLNVAMAGEDGFGTERINLIADEAPRPDEEVEARLTSQRNHKLVALGLDSLKPRERDIIERRVLSEDPLTLEELSQVYSITRERVRQIEAAALEKMRKAITRASPAYA